MRKLVVRLGLLALCVTILYACREPTQVTVRLTTDASCGGDGFREAAIAVASLSALASRAPTALTDACTPGDTQADIGTIVVVPSEEDDDSFAVRVVAGIGVSAEACPPPSYVLGPEDTAAGRGCIVARRNMGFVPHTKLELPIVLRQTCLNVDCAERKTCVDGACVSAKVDSEKCAEPGGCSEDDLVGGAGGGGTGGAGGVGGRGGSGGRGGQGGAGGPIVATQIAVGDTFSCAVVEGRAVCWGLDEPGAWGIGSPTVAPRGPTEVMTSHAGEIVELAAGRQHLCIRLNDGTVECAGDNSRAQLGATMPSQSTEPLPIALLPASQIAAGPNHTCAALASTVSCWGANDTGQVKLPVGMPISVPSPLPFSVNHIAPGVGHTCVAETDQTVRCWGDSQYFQVGYGAMPPQGPTIVMYAGGGGAFQGSAVSAGEKHSCAIEMGDDVYCWGREDGTGQQFGDGSPVGPGSPDPKVNGVMDVSRIATGKDATCVVAPGGGLRCWGVFDGPWSIDGVQGVPTDSPLSIMTNENVEEVAVGKGHACYRDELGHVYCWGNNSSGQVSIDEGSAPVWPPVQIVLP